MKRYLFVAILVLIVGIKQGCTQERPNIILFVVDDLGYYDLSMTGSELYETPNVDKLAAEGISYTNAYVSHPRCVPSRYGLHTGKFPARGQVPGGRQVLTKDDITMAMPLQEAGYKTFFAGKWHVGKDEATFPQGKGYQINIAGGTAGAPISYFFPYNEKSDPNDRSKHKKIYGLDEGEAGEYLTDRLTYETVDFINKNANEPFFITLAHYGVHTPFQAKQDQKKKYRQKVQTLAFDDAEYITKDGTTKLRQDNPTYAAMIESVDESLGKLVATLKEHGIYDNTAIIFTSDHGGLSNRGIESKRKLATTNKPLRAGKGHVYEGGIKVPFIVYWKGKIMPGLTSDQLTINTDIFPTILDIAGLPMMPEAHLDGESIRYSFSGETYKERTFFWHSPMGRPNSTGDENASAIRIGDHKLINYYDKDITELYNLAEDPFEREDLSEADAKMAKKLLKELDKWKKEVNAIKK